MSKTTTRYTISYVQRVQKGKRELYQFLVGIWDQLLTLMCG